MKTQTDNITRWKFAKSKFKYVILILTFLSLTLLFYSQIPKATAKTNVNYAKYYYFYVDGTDVNVTINANVGILEDGGISIWGFVVNVITNLSVPHVRICGMSNGSKYTRGLTFPTSNDLKDDTALKGAISLINPSTKVFSGIMLENLLLAPEIHGIPNTFSFKMKLFVGNDTINQTLTVSSGDNPLVAFIFQNPEAIPELGSLFFALIYGLPFLLPITVIIINVIHKKLKKRKELKLKEGGTDNEG
ncbi:MAG: hypothetical protein HWN67_23215 [Candidatus Helarchaeota archaeon]|nr:hypothetical protein [Candidatus Helarchaeota archaeon]